jgi:hypothetical protein
VVHGGLRVAAAKGLVGVHAGWHFHASNLAGEDQKEEGCSRNLTTKLDGGGGGGAHDLAGDERIKQRQNKLR